jgi:UDPglucose 6-dehydrogenase
MQIAVVGTGYVGLVSGACFAEIGHNVICVDNNAAKVEVLLNGGVPIYEPGLAELVARNVAAGRLSFTTVLADAVADAAATFIAVGTPTRKSDGHADLSYVFAVAEEVARVAKPGMVVVTKSTVPIGTGDEVEHLLKQHSAHGDFSVVSNPEFLREGAAIGDFMKPDRIIIGSNDTRGADVMRDLYKPLTDDGAPLLVMSRRSSELTKYAANAFLSAKITFINEIADLCEKAQADVLSVSKGIGLDDRIGAKFLMPGPGYGGSCFPKDTIALLKSSEDFEAPQRIVETVVAVNEARKRTMGRKILAALGPRPRGKTVCLLGLTFKPNTDDMRDSPSIAITQTLQDAGVHVRGCDPEGIEQAQTILDNVEFHTDPYVAMTGADLVAIVTEWDDYRNIDLPRAKGLLASPVLVDLRNVYDRATVEPLGFTYHAVGR